ncbi:MAG: hypothetical protein KDI51_20145, partial [Xanthomonadales bacterium]|nr:hypothetical protein [Xanthomonadales bacterium]
MAAMEEPDPDQPVSELASAVGTVNIKLAARTAHNPHRPALINGLHSRPASVLHCASFMALGNSRARSDACDFGKGKLRVCLICVSFSSNPKTGAAD